MLKLLALAVKDSPLAPERREVLVAELRRNDPRLMRRIFHTYLRYLDRHGSVASRLCGAGVPAWVVHGETGDGGVTDQERATLKACPRIRMITIPGPSFFTPNEDPALVAELITKRSHTPARPPTTDPGPPFEARRWAGPARLDTDRQSPKRGLSDERCNWR